MPKSRKNIAPFQFSPEIKQNIKEINFKAFHESFEPLEACAGLINLKSVDSIMLSSRVVIHFAIVCFVNSNYGLERTREIPAADAIRHVVNDIFSDLRINMNKSNKIKKYSTFHNHFVKVTRHEIDNWNEVLKSSRLDVKIVNGSADFTTVINELLNEENKAEGASNLFNDDNVNKCIENFLSTLTKFKENYLFNNSYSTENNEILQLYYKNRNNSEDNPNTSTRNGDKDSNNADVWVPSESRRIFQGRRTKIEHYPFMASVHLLNQFTCAGSLIHADLVIIAASCLQLAYNNRFFREKPLFLTVRTGSSFYDVGGDLIPVLEVYFHPLYDPPTLRNNLAIMRLQRRIKFRKKERKVKRIEIDQNAWALPPNTAGITVVGWGAKNTLNKGRTPWEDKLSKADLDYYPIYECQKIYPKSQVTDKSFCAGFFSQGSGACNRDVGAPGLVGGLLVGVVSFGSTSCGATDAPTVFTKIGYYADWIESIIEQTPTLYTAKPTTRRRPYFYPTIEATTELTDYRFTIQPIDLSRADSSRETNVRTLYNKKFEEFLSNPNYQEPTAKKRTQEKNKNHVQKKKTIYTKSLEDPDRIIPGSRSSSESTFEPNSFKPTSINMAYLDIEEFYGISERDKKYAKIKDKLTTAISVPVPVHQDVNLYFEEGASTKKDRSVISSKIISAPKLHQPNTSSNNFVPLQQTSPVQTEEQKILRDFLKVVKNMKPDPKLTNAQQLLTFDQSNPKDSEPFKQSLEGSEPIKKISEDFEPKKQSPEDFELIKQRFEGFQLQQSPEGFEPTKQSPGGSEPIKKISEGFEPKKQSPEDFELIKQRFEGFQLQQSPEGFEPTKQSPEGSEPIKKISEGFKPIKQSPEDFEPIKQSFEGFQPIKPSPGGFEPIKQSPENFQPIKQSFEGFEPIKQSPEDFEPKKIQNSNYFKPLSFEYFEPKKPQKLVPMKSFSLEDFLPHTQHIFRGYDPKTQYSSEGFDPKKQHIYENIQPNKQHRSKHRYEIEGTDSEYEVYKSKKQHSFKGFKPEKQQSSKDYKPKIPLSSESVESRKPQSSKERNKAFRPSRIKIDGTGLPMRQPVKSIVRQLDDKIDQIIDIFNVNKAGNSKVVKPVLSKVQEHLKHQGKEDNPARNSDILSQLYMPGNTKSHIVLSK